MAEVPAALPPAFVERLRALTPAAHWPALEASWREPSAPVLRVNTLLTEVPPLLAALRASGLTPEPLPWRADSFQLPIGQRETLVHHPAASDGRFYIQNPASIFCAQCVAAEPGEEVLDLCAAPGGKTLVLAAAMANRGRLAAVEAVKGRFHKLVANLERGGVTMAHPYLKDGTRVGRQTGPRFDRVLLDAPCSSEARFTLNDPASFAFWSEKKISDMQRKQKQLLHSALLALKPGGRLIYSTCSYAPEENEAVLDRALRKWGDAVTLLPLQPPFANWQPGLTTWGKKTFAPQVEKAVRILPDGVMEGFFIAAIEKRA